CIPPRQRLILRDPPARDAGILRASPAGWRRGRISLLARELQSLLRRAPVSAHLKGIGAMNELRARIFGAKRDNVTESGAPVFHSLTGLRFVLACWIAYFHVGLMFDSEGFGSLPLLELGMTRV